jgi:glycosyltransferase involved in cell wall biosynthesis
MNSLVRLAFALSDAVVLLAHSEKRDFESMGIKGRLFIIPNAVDLSEYSEFRARVHSGKVLRCAYLGRLVREKGIFEAIEAIEVLRSEEHYRDIELRIAGSGPAEKEIADVIAQRELGDCVTLVGSVYGHSKVRFLGGSDVLIFPSYHPEGLPYVILESLASGTPVIASRVAGIPDVVMDGVHGILVNTRDPGDIVRGVHELGRSADELRAMSRRCFSWAEQELGLERLARQFTELYETIRC